MRRISAGVYRRIIYTQEVVFVTASNSENA